MIEEKQEYEGWQMVCSDLLLMVFYPFQECLSEVVTDLETALATNDLELFVSVEEKMRKMESWFENNIPTMWGLDQKVEDKDNE